MHYYFVLSIWFFFQSTFITIAASLEKSNLSLFTHPQNRCQINLGIEISLWTQKKKTVSILWQQYTWCVNQVNHNSSCGFPQPNTPIKWSYSILALFKAHVSHIEKCRRKIADVSEQICERSSLDPSVAAHFPCGRKKSQNEYEPLLVYLDTCIVIDDAVWEQLVKLSCSSLRAEGGEGDDGEDAANESQL